jgi:hypothetical protein
LQRGYADIATRGAWHEVASLLTPDCHITFDTRSGRIFEIDGADEFGEFAAKMTGVFAFYEYIPQNFVVTVRPDGTASGRSYSLEVAEDAQTGDWIEFYGVYNDEYALIESGWRFSQRHYQTYARRRAGQLEAFKLSNDDPGDSAAVVADP